MKAMIAVIKRGVAGISRFLFVLSEISLVVITLIVFLSVIMRYVLNDPFHWNIEVTCWLFVFMVFMGAAELTRRGNHIIIDLIIDRLREPRRKIVEFLILCFSVFWCVLIDWQAWKTTLNAYKFEVTSSSLLRFPLFIPYSFLSVGFLLLALNLVILLAEKAMKVFRPRKEIPNV